MNSPVTSVTGRPPRTTEPRCSPRAGQSRSEASGSNSRSRKRREIRSAGLGSRPSPQHSSVSRGGLATWQMRAVTRHIEEHVHERTPLVALAKLVRLSPSHFCRAFRQSFGIPPHEYHIRRRIEKAKTLLAEREASVTGVGFALGYSHTSSFSVAFRKITGQTPIEFRRDFT
jgi:AraC-like DNA-binding protein